MRVQVNSDSTVSVDARSKRFVKSEVERILENFADKVTRVEVHLSDVNSHRSGPADKRCLVEVRPAGAKPLSTTATAEALPAAIVLALRKMKRSLTSFFGRQGWAVASSRDVAPKPSARKRAGTTAAAPTQTPARDSAVSKAAVTRRPAPKAPAAVTPAETPASPGATPARGPRKKPIFQARRKAWPTR